MMNDALQAFADYCARHTIDQRPAMFAQYVDIWQEPRGEIGVADPQDITETCFALLSPWAMIPTLAETWLIVDTVDALAVVNLKVNVRGMFNPHWSVPYNVADDGALSFGEATAGPTPHEISLAVQAAKRARMVQIFWEDMHTLETAVPLVMRMLA